MQPTCGESSWFSKPNEYIEPEAAQAVHCEKG